MYKILRYIAIISFITLIQQQLFAVEGRPKMRRACLNRSDSTINLLWFRPTDNCGSFTSFSIYGREDALSLYKYMGKYINFALNSVQFKLPNLKDWEFYLVYSLDCNGTDSVYSDTIIIDNTPPANSEIDSVSVDFTTQTTIIGWKQNPSKDIKGYNLYYNNGNTNAIINVLTGTFANDTDPSRKPTTAGYLYGIAAFDSCNNTSLISPLHKTIHLRSAYDQCKMQIFLNWSGSGYVGWPIEYYDVFLSINGGAYQRAVRITTPLNVTDFTYRFSRFGDQYCFYIRAKKLGENVTSSSNITCVSSGTIIPSDNSYIAKVSVQNEAVELTLITQTGTGLQKVNIYKAEDNHGFSLWQTVNTTGGVLELVDRDVKVHTKNYSYFFSTEGVCGLVFDSSQICKTILLKLQMNAPGDQNLSWNEYLEFKKTTERQELLLINTPNANKSSSWNITNTFSPTRLFANDTSKFSSTLGQLCYCVRAIELPANQFYRRQDTSYSNIECATADPIVYFPNAIQINGFNNEFYPQGVFLDYAKSSFQIFNRWGQLIYETSDIRKGWGVKNSSGDLIEEDIYAYKSVIVGINGKKLVFDGTVTVLK